MVNVKDVKKWRFEVVLEEDGCKTHTCDEAQKNGGGRIAVQMHGKVKCVCAKAASTSRMDASFTVNKSSKSVNILA